MTPTETPTPLVPTVTVWPARPDASCAVSVRRYDNLDAITVSYQPSELAAAELAAFLRGCLADAYTAGRADATASALAVIRDRRDMFGTAADASAENANRSAAEGNYQDAADHARTRDADSHTARVLIDLANRVSLAADVHTAR